MAGRYRGYIVDLDGTVYKGASLVAGAATTVAALRARGSRLLFVSNNALVTRRDIAAKLQRLGIPAAEADVINSSWALAATLRERTPGARCFVIGSESLQQDLIEAGLQIATAGERADFVVLSADRQLTWDKMREGLRLVHAGVPMVATHPDVTIPSEEGDVPDAGTVIAAMEAAAGETVRWVAGKPARTMMEKALAILQLPNNECLVVGDRLDTDIRFGAEHGVATALVLTGVARSADVKSSPWQPTYVLDSITELEHNP